MHYARIVNSTCIHLLLSYIMCVYYTTCTRYLACIVCIHCAFNYYLIITVLDRIINYIYYKLKVSVSKQGWYKI